MKHPFAAPARRFGLKLLLLVLSCLGWLPVRAGLTVDIHLYHDTSGGYYFYPYLSTNTTPPDYPTGTLRVSSPQQPTNGSWYVFLATPTSFDYGDGNGNYGGGSYYNDFDSFLYGITNGLWSIDVTNAVATNHFKFKVTVTGLTSNAFGAPVVVSFPTEGEMNVTNQPTFNWTGPANWAGDLYVSADWIDTNGNYYGQASDNLPPSATSWPCPVVLPDGTNNFYIRYSSNVTALVIASTPTNAAAQPVSGWISTANLESGLSVQFVVGQAQNAFDLFLVGRYDFEDTNSPGTDSSGNDNNANCGSGNGGTNLDTFSTDAAVGTYARKYFGDTSICFSPGSPAFDSLSNALMGSFSVTARVKTTNSVNDDFANAYFGAPILFAYSSNTNSTVPLSITGSKAAFTINDPLGGGTTIHSTTSVNDGNYHLLVVTRNQTNGLMSVYVDGNLEATGTGTTEPLFITTTLYLAGGWYANFQGLVDDVRVYASELTAADVAVLSGNTAGSLGTALNAPTLPWTTGGDASWFVQSTNTHDRVAAAQSGAIGNDGQTWIETAVTGPGTLSFWWRVSSEENYDYLEFLMDGSLQNDMSGDSGWQQQTYSVAPGAHTLRWNYRKDGSDNAFLDAGFLDEVNYVPAPPPDTNTPPIITLHPFSQTNQPGYSVALLAAATSNAAITWEWFKAGSAAPLPNATNALFIPANSGTAGVAGDYFAIVTNNFGSATTLVATVTFQSAALPPDWSRAFRSQLYGNGEDPTTNFNIACLLDSAGNIYTTGSLIGTNLFGSDTLISANGVEESIFLKQTATGTPIWGRGMTNNGNGHSFPRCLAAAPGDGFYAMGLFGGTNWLGTNKLVAAAGAATYLARFDANGSNLWVRTIVGTNSSFPTHHTLVSDPAGNVTLSALVSGYTSLGTTNLFVEGQRGILAQYDLNGNVRWVQVPSAWPSYLTYSAGRIYGSMSGDLTNYIGGVTNVSDRRQALFSLNATNGQGLWLRGLAAGKDQGNPSGFGSDDALVAVSGTNVFVTGTSYGSNAVFGPFAVTFPAGPGQYFARYDTNGNAQLATAFGSQFTWPWAVVADASGNVFVGGDFDTYSIFGGNIIAAPFYETVQFIGTTENRIPGQGFVAKFDRNGNPLWARLAQSPSSYLNLRDIALAPDGVWACGFFNPIAYFGTNTIYGGITCVGSPFCTPVFHQSGYLAKITDSGAAGLPVTLLYPQTVGTNFQFQFLSQAGFSHAVQYRTNLVAGSNWQTYTNVTGDGSLKTLTVPLSVFSPSAQGFIRVSTQ